MVLAFLSASTSAANAARWQEGGYEGSSVCDHDGDGVFSLYEAVVGATALEMFHVSTNAQGVTRVDGKQRLTNTEYFSEGETPESVFYTGNIHFFGEWDAENQVLVDGFITVFMTVTDAENNDLEKLSIVAKVADWTYERVLHIKSGASGACMKPTAGDPVG